MLQLIIVIPAPGRGFAMARLIVVSIDGVTARRSLQTSSDKRKLSLKTSLSNLSLINDKLETRNDKRINEYRKE